MGGIATVWGYSQLYIIYYFSGVDAKTLVLYHRQVEALQQELASKVAGLAAAQQEVQGLAATAAERQKRFGLLHSTFRKKEVRI